MYSTFHLNILKTISILSMTNNKFLLQDTDKSNYKILLVIAHPDDETIFFSPLLILLRHLKYRTHILCLSNGNFDGLGGIREKELIDSAATFGIEETDVRIINNPLLQDNLYNYWPSFEVAKEIEKYMKEICPISVFTFDNYGVSGHKNHISTYYGAKIVYNKLKDTDRYIPFYELESVSLIRRFSGINDLFFTFYAALFLLFLQIFNVKKYSENNVVCSLNNLSVIYAMNYHKSQLSIIMRIHILLSRYSYVNTYKRIE